MIKRVRGIEPLSLAWKAKVLPLNYTRRLLFKTFTIITIFSLFDKILITKTQQGVQTPCLIANEINTVTYSKELAPATTSSIC